MNTITMIIKTVLAVLTNSVREEREMRGLVIRNIEIELFSAIIGSEN